jgi:flagellar motility protein MotE (MotC chaperone)
MAATAGSRAIGGVALIVTCFLGSAAMRLAANGQAFADELGALAEAEAEGATAGATCPSTEDAETLLGAIREREDELAKESLRLAERAQTLNVAEAKLGEQLAAFETAQKNLEETLAVADKAAERDIERMTTVYENMKPAEAAEIFERKDVSFAAGLLARVRPEIAAQVLAAMNADSAYAVTLTIASRNHAVPTE